MRGIERWRLPNKCIFYFDRWTRLRRQLNFSASFLSNSRCWVRISIDLPWSMAISLILGVCVEKFSNVVRRCGKASIVNNSRTYMFLCVMDALRQICNASIATFDDWKQVICYRGITFQNRFIDKAAQADIHLLTPHSIIQLVNYELQKSRSRCIIFFGWRFSSITNSDKI